MTAKVHYADLWGVREVYEEGADGERVLTGGKYQWLWRHDVTSTEWRELEPQAPFYLFVPQDADLLPEYNRYWSVTNLFETYASTVTTARNDFSMAYAPDILVERINDLRDKSIDDDSLRSRYPLKDVSYWTLSSARKKLQTIQDVESFVQPYCYRPFDFRFVYYHEAVCERLRAEVMQHMTSGDNLAFLTHRP